MTVARPAHLFGGERERSDVGPIGEDTMNNVDSVIQPASEAQLEATLEAQLEATLEAQLEATLEARAGRSGA